MAQDEIGRFKVIAIGGSAGSLHVILTILTALPSPLAALIIIVVHRRNGVDSILETLLSTRTKLAVKEVEDKQPIHINTIYIAPPDYHLLVENEDCFSLDSSEKINFSRPSIDVCFESIAAVFGSRVTGILLSGANADGAAGLAAIRKMGGYTIVQNPVTAEVDFMPRQAIALGTPDEIVDAGAMAERILQQVKE